MESTDATRLLVVGSAVGARTAVQLGKAYVNLWRSTTPDLVDGWIAAWGVNAGDDPAKAFREGLINASTEWADKANKLTRKGIKDLTKYTTPDEPAGGTS